MQQTRSLLRRARRAVPAPPARRVRSDGDLRERFLSEGLGRCARGLRAILLARDRAARRQRRQQLRRGARALRCAPAGPCREHVLLVVVLGPAAQPPRAQAAQGAGAALRPRHRPHVPCAGADGARAGRRAVRPDEPGRPRAGRPDHLERRHGPPRGAAPWSRCTSSEPWRHGAAGGYRVRAPPRPSHRDQRRDGGRHRDPGPAPVAGRSSTCEHSPPRASRVAKPRHVTSC